MYIYSHPPTEMNLYSRCLSRRVDSLHTDGIDTRNCIYYYCYYYNVYKLITIARYKNNKYRYVSPRQNNNNKTGACDIHYSQLDD